MSDETIVEVMARALNDHNEDQWADPCKEWAASALSALRDAGYAVVPVEPTEAMLSAGGQAAAANYWCDRDSSCLTMEVAYRAMIAAATPSQSPE